ncbi:hypothetical protein VTK56DRAFT_2517 [Thermocarpiscus australiensis]
MYRSLSPEGGPKEPKALIAQAESVTGLLLDDDDPQVFIKEEPLSPAADADGLLLTPRVQPLKYKAGAPSQKASGSGPQEVGRASAAQQQVVRHGRHGGKGAAPSKAALLRASQSPGQPVVPRRVEDWEPWKDILHELYITQNRILRDIINIMETKYNLKATPKMYKNQFARWGFFKYAVKRRPRAKTQSTIEKGQDGALDGTLILRKDALMHESDGSRSLQVGLSAVRRFLHGHIDLDSANLQLEEVAGFVDPCYRYFKTAMDLFDLRENVEGGRVLRLAFLQIERKISKPTMKSFSDLCFLVPHLLLESSRKDILAAYLGYLARLAAVKFGKHPVAELAASFAAMVDRPEDMMRYVMLLARVNADTIAGLAGILDRTRRWARTQSLACQRTREPPPAWPLLSSSSSAAARHDHSMIRLEAQSVYWAQNLVMQDPESDALADQWLRRQFEPGFGARCEAFLAGFKARVAAGAFPAVFARMMECLMVGWLHDYYETAQEWDRVWEWGRRGLELSTDEQYVLWSIHLEELMRLHGRPEEAEELRRRRQAHAWLERVRLEVDRLSIA